MLKKIKNFCLALFKQCLSEVCFTIVVCTAMSRMLSFDEVANFDSTFLVDKLTDLGKGS